MSQNKIRVAKEIFSQVYNEKYGTDFRPETLTTSQLILIAADYIQRSEPYRGKVKELLPTERYAHLQLTNRESSLKDRINAVIQAFERTIFNGVAQHFPSEVYEQYNKIEGSPKCLRGFCTKVLSDREQRDKVLEKMKEKALGKEFDRNMEGLINATPSESSQTDMPSRQEEQNNALEECNLTPEQAQQLFPRDDG